MPPRGIIAAPRTDDSTVMQFRPWLTPTLLCFGVQVLLISISFPIQELLTDKPVLFYDTGFHWYEIWFARQIAATGNVIGYDPLFSAGIVDGVNLNQSAKAPALLSILTGSSAAVAYKCFVFLTAAFAPASLVKAASMFGAKKLVQWITGLLAIIVWWSSDVRAYYSIGMAAWAGACFFAIPLSQSIVRGACRSAPVRRAIEIALLAAALAFYHPLSPLLVAGTVVALVWPNADALGLTQIVRMVALVCVVVLGVNAWWLLDALRYPASADGLALADPALASTLSSLLWQPLFGVKEAWPHGSKLYLVLIAAAPFSILDPDTRRRRFWIVSLLLAVFAHFYAVYAGLSTALAYSQPNRIGVYAMILLAIPAAAGIGELATRATTTFRSAGYPRSARLLAPLVLIVVGVCYFVVEVGREVSSRRIGHYGAVPPDVNGSGPITEALEEWLIRNTDGSGRILFEQTTGNSHDSAQIVGYLAARTNREFIGGPYPALGFVTFENASISRRPVDQFTDAEFARFTELYNIRWAIAWNPRTKAYLDARANVLRMIDVDSIRAYEIRRDPSFFLRGGGRVTDRGPNRLVLDDLEGDDIVIRYHHVPPLQAADPATTVEPYVVEGSRVPFVRLRNAPRHVELRIPPASILR